jgi:hypothetical protein
MLSLQAAAFGRPAPSLSRALWRDGQAARRHPPSRDLSVNVPYNSAHSFGTRRRHIRAASRVPRIQSGGDSSVLHIGRHHAPCNSARSFGIRRRHIPAASRVPRTQSGAGSSVPHIGPHHAPCIGARILGRGRRPGRAVAPVPRIQLAAGSYIGRARLPERPRAGCSHPGLDQLRLGQPSQGSRPQPGRRRNYSHRSNSSLGPPNAALFNPSTSPPNGG